MFALFSDRSSLSTQPAPYHLEFLSYCYFYLFIERKKKKHFLFSFIVFAIIKNYYNITVNVIRYIAALSLSHCNHGIILIDFQYWIPQIPCIVHFPTVGFAKRCEEDKKTEFNPKHIFFSTICHCWRYCYHWLHTEYVFFSTRLLADNIFLLTLSISPSSLSSSLSRSLFLFTPFLSCFTLALCRPYVGIFQYYPRLTFKNILRAHKGAPSYLLSHCLLWFCRLLL